MSVASVFLVGTAFCGSTLLGRDLTSYLADTHYIGEMNNLTQYPGLHHRTSERGCHPCEVLHQDCPYFTDELVKANSFADIAALHASLGASLGASVVIDGSKHVAWLQVAMAQVVGRNSALRPAVLIATRNPIAFALSFRHRHAVPLWEAGVIWRDTYVDALRTANGWGLPSMVVRYEDFMADPVSVRAKVAAFLHQSVRITPLLNQCHDVGGNWSSLVPYLGRDQVNRYIAQIPDEEGRREAEIFVQHARAYWQDGVPREDSRWWHSLDAGEVNEVLSQPGLSDVALLLGYNLADVVGRALRSAQPRGLS
ncbi:MAG TPA: hypothetical protein VE081_11075 [Sporichthyaceae bacterium]|nr:hypothetical protein [Sporichthyaceae bacterium]